MALKIEEMFAFVMVGDDGDEGVIGVEKGGVFMPLLGADMTRVEDLRPIAAQIVRRAGRPYRILHFKLVGEL